jgi:hydroxyacylglutathione hydrolase
MDWPQAMRMRSKRLGMTEQEAPFRDLKLDDIKKLIDDGYEVVDVREDWEWNKGHLPGARHLVLNTLLANPTAQKFRDRTIFVCAMGERSAVASEMAVALGVKDVVNFRGGTKAWRDAGLPLETL